MLFFFLCPDSCSYEHCKEMGIGVVGMAAILPTDVVPSSLLPGLEKVKTLLLSVFFFMHMCLYREIY